MKVIKSVNETNRENVTTMLRDTIDAGFDAVVIVGFRLTEGTVEITSSRNTSRLEMLGALREAEHQLLTNGEPL